MADWRDGKEHVSYCFAERGDAEFFQMHFGGEFVDPRNLGPWSRLNGARSKQAGLPAPKEKPSTRPGNVVNLMDALKRSIQDTGRRQGKAKASKAPAKKAEAAPRAKKKARG